MENQSKKSGDYDSIGAVGWLMAFAGLFLSSIAVACIYRFAWGALTLGVGLFAIGAFWIFIAWAATVAADARKSS